MKEMHKQKRQTKILQSKLFAMQLSTRNAVLWVMMARGERRWRNKSSPFSPEVILRWLLVWDDVIVLNITTQTLTRTHTPIEYSNSNHTTPSGSTTFCIFIRVCCSPAPAKSRIALSDPLNTEQVTERERVLFIAGYSTPKLMKKLSLQPDNFIIYEAVCRNLCIPFD